MAVGVHSSQRNESHITLRNKHEIQPKKFVCKDKNQSVSFKTDSEHEQRALRKMMKLNHQHNQHCYFLGWHIPGINTYMRQRGLNRPLVKIGGNHLM